MSRSATPRPSLTSQVSLLYTPYVSPRHLCVSGPPFLSPVVLTGPLCLFSYLLLTSGTSLPVSLTRVVPKSPSTSCSKDVRGPKPHVSKVSTHPHPRFTFPYLCLLLPSPLRRVLVWYTPIFLPTLVLVGAPSRVRRFP